MLAGLTLSYIVPVPGIVPEERVFANLLHSVSSQPLHPASKSTLIISVRDLANHKLSRPSL